MHKTKNTSRVAIIILNWNGWRDTIECLESVFRLNYHDYQVIVCDNGSKDGSLDHIRAWAEGRLAASTDGPPWSILMPGAVAKPIVFADYPRVVAEAGGDPALHPPLVLIQTGANLGFAGGNNVGFRYALTRGEFEYFWLLNNDTVIACDALSHLVNRMQEKPEAGMCGSTLLYYYHPDKVQALGGATYDKWRAISKHIGVFQPASQEMDVDQVESQMAYVIGASMLVSRDFLVKTGLMSEDYFLYYEEIDWACRAKGKYAMAYSPKSRVYHKEGGSIGSSHTGEASPLSLQMLYRNRLLFVRRHYRHYYLINVAYVVREMLTYLKRGNFIAARIILRALVRRPVGIAVPSRNIK